MSTVVDNPESSSAQSSGELSSQYDDFIDQRLQRTSFHLKSLDLIVGGMILGLFLLGSLLLLVLVDHWVYGLSVFWRYVALLLIPSVSCFLGIRFLLLPLTRRINPEFAAHTVERAHPELKNGLISFLFFRERRNLLRTGVYQGLKHQAATDLTHIPIDSALDRSAIIRLGYGMIALVTIWVAYVLLSPKNPLQTIQRVVMPWRDIARPSQVQVLDVSPGDVEIYRGQAVEITAQVMGLKSDEVPDIVYSTQDGLFVDQRIPLSQDKLPNHFVGQLAMSDHGVQNDLEYWIEAGDATSRRFGVRVLEMPHIQVERLVLDYPDYTGRASETVRGEGDIRAIEGTRIKILGKANQAIQSGSIEFLPKATSEPPRRAALSVLSGDETQATFDFRLRMNVERTDSLYRGYFMEFTNHQGKSSVDSIQHSIEVIPDRRPVVEILRPDRRTIEVPENASQTIEVRAVDPDFKLTRVQLAARTRGRNLFRESLLEEWHQGQFTAEYAFIPSELGLREGDVVEYLALAEDNRHSIDQSKLDPNRTISSKQYIRIVKADPGLEESDAANRDSDSAEGTDANDPENSSDDNQPNKGEDGGEKKPGEQGESGDQSQASKSEGGQEQSQNQSSGEDGEQGEQNQSSDPDGGQSGLQQDSNSSGDVEQESEGGGNPGQSSDSESEASSEQSGGDQADDGQGDSNKSPGDAGETNDSTSNRNPTGEDPQAGDSGGESGQDEPLPSSGERDGEVVERIRDYMREQGELDQDESQSDEPASDQDSQSSNDPAADESSSSENEDPADDQTSPNQSTGKAASDQEQRSDSSTDSDASQNADSEGQGASHDDDQHRDSAKSNGDTGKPEGDAGEKQNGNASTDPGNKQNPAASKNKGATDSQGSDSNDETGTGSPEESSGDNGQGSQDQEGGRDATSDRRKGQGDEGSDTETGKTGPDSSESDSATGGDHQEDAQEGVTEPGDDATSGQGQQDATSSDEGASGDQAKHSDAASQSANKNDDPPSPQDSQQNGNAESSESSSESNSSKSGNGKKTKGSQANPSNANPQSAQPGTADAGSSNHGEGSQHQEGPGGDDANLEYARKATDLVLEYLRDQKRQTDPELLEKLGWSQQDVEKFLKRWDQMKKNATGPAPEAQKGRTKLDEILKGMGLNPPNAQLKRSADQVDTQRDNRNTGQMQKVPADLADPFRAFQRGLQLEQ